METLELKLLKQLELSWNKLNTDYIKTSLSDEIVYESQWVLIPIIGKAEVLMYLKNKFKTIKREMKSGITIIKAKIGYLPAMNKRPCIVLSQIISNKFNEVTILIEVKQSLISRIDLCFIPDPSKVIILN
jgi:hypothetical protein